MNKRDAINEILGNLNERTLDVDDLVDEVPTAKIIDEQINIAKKKILSYGWENNTITYNLSPDVDGYIKISEEWLAVDGSDDNNYVVRDSKLFNRETMSFKFEGSVSVVVIEDIVFDDLPYHLANYVVQLASLTSYINIIGNTTDITIRRDAVDNARIEALRNEANAIDGNLLDSEFATTLLDRTSI